MGKLIAKKNGYQVTETTASGRPYFQLWKLIFDYKYENGFEGYDEYGVVVGSFSIYEINAGWHKVQYDCK